MGSMWDFKATVAILNVWNQEDIFLPKMKLLLQGPNLMALVIAYSYKTLGISNFKKCNIPKAKAIFPF